MFFPSSSPLPSPCTSWRPVFSTSRTTHHIVVYTLAEGDCVSTSEWGSGTRAHKVSGYLSCTPTHMYLQAVLKGNVAIQHLHHYQLWYPWCSHNIVPGVSCVVYVYALQLLLCLGVWSCPSSVAHQWSPLAGVNLLEQTEHLTMGECVYIASTTCFFDPLVPLWLLTIHHMQYLMQNSANLKYMYMYM